MCTVTFLPRRSGYALGMNRDEKLTRPTALPPAMHRVGAREVVYPAEPGGGTWMGLNDAGVCLALINWYSVPERVTEKPISRGEVVRALLAAGEPDFADEALAAAQIERVHPFR